MNTKQPYVMDLLGKLSSTGEDYRLDHHRARYSQSVSVNADSFFSMKVDKLDPTALLDCRHIKMRFVGTITSTDLNVCIANNHAYPFSSVRILSGTKTLLDI